MADARDVRRYDERETAAILQRTAELYARQLRRGDRAIPARAADADAGLTLGQLEHIAAEAGLDPAMVRRAAAEVDGSAAPERHWFLGAADTIDVERVVAGEVADTERLLALVRQLTGEVGETETVGRAFGWRAKVNGAPTQVSISASGGRTSIRVRVSLEELAVGSFMSIGFGGGGIGGITTAAALVGPIGALGFLAGAGVLGVGYLTARTVYSRAARRHAARAIELAEGIAADL